ncbi:hypothetical protein CEXT_743051 [Caerostris extrusa]|uniref:4Fe-4S ferredoxin-type domain-containing protein n=1 Tax=Caerostris extrusa TaxID=172846 RepID=A0AAV4UWN4_CAEEX|nr:hypothetical protein CEXT_743051 [Caerostris extrusa]
MNLYYMHCRKKNPKENDFVSEKPEQYKTPKIKFPTKSCDINRLAMEHAQAYVQKPWDSYLKEESIVKSCMKCVPCASVCDYGTNVKKPNVVNYYTQTPCYPKQLYESNFQMPYAKYDSANTVAATVKSQKIRITQAGISSLPWKNYSRFNMCLLSIFLKFCLYKVVYLLPLNY